MGPRSRVEWPLSNAQSVQRFVPGRFFRFWAILHEIGKKVLLAQLASMVCRAIYREGDEYDGRTRRYLIFDGTDRFALITFPMVA